MAVRLPHLSLAGLCFVVGLGQTASVSANDLDAEVTHHHGRTPGGITLLCDQYNAGYEFGSAFAALGDDRFVVGIPRYNSVARTSPVCIYFNSVGELRIYNLQGQQQRVVPHPPRRDGITIADSRFGSALAAVGTGHFVAGSPYFDSDVIGNSGAVEVFDNNGDWIRRVVNPEPSGFGVFGSALVGVAEDTFLVGAWGNNQDGRNNAGSAYLYGIDGTMMDSFDGEEAGDWFGFAVGAVDDDTILIGAPLADDQRGKVYLTDLGNPSTELQANDPAPGDNFGHAVAGVGTDLFVVGAPNADIQVLSNQGGFETLENVGKVYLFDASGAQLDTFENPDPGSGDSFGYRLARFGSDRLLISAHRKKIGSDTAGAVYVFNLAGDRLATVENPEPETAVEFTFDTYGVAFAGVGDEHFVVGAPHEDFNQIDSGSSYLYHAPIDEIQVGTEIPRPKQNFSIGLLPATGPELEPPDAGFWHAPTQKLYATKTGQLIIRWGQGTNPTNTTQVLNYWPVSESDYQIHVANTPGVDLGTEGVYSYAEVMEQDGNLGTDANEVRNDLLFGATSAGRTLLMLSTGTNPKTDPIFFQYVKAIDWNDPAYLQDDVPATIGEAILPPDDHDPDCGAPFAYWEKSRYCPTAGYYDRAARTGQIIPVNTDVDGTEEDDLAIVYYQKGTKLIDGEGAPMASDICWPWVPYRYTAAWPSDPEKIIIANLDPQTRLAVDGDTFVNWDLYYQNNPELAGYNPNDEHAVRRPWGESEAIFPIRSDLGTPDTSEPYVLMTYQDPQDGMRPKIKVFQVVAEEDPYFFRYGAEAGTLIQAPFPLSLFQKCPETAGISGPYWRDRKLDFWARAAGDDGGTDDIVMHFYYPVQVDFFFPGPNPPAPGSHVPLLDLYAGTPSEPVDVTYAIHWPEVVPELRVAETLVKPKNGLPDISLQSSAQVIYQQSVENGGGSSVLLIDPTVEHEVDLDERPPDAEAISQAGKFYFPSLPPPLRNRFTYDPINRKLEFRGEFIEPVAGEYYLLVNVITDRERTILRNLSTDFAFRSAVDDLVAAAGRAAPVSPNSTGFDSLALTAGFATGTGYVTLAFGNSTILTPEPDPISLEVIKVTCPTYRGEIKVIESDNPFDEKLTLRHSGDFAGRPDEYLFEWRTLPPVDGLPSEAPPNQWATFTPVPPNGQGALDITIEGPGLFTLSDNYFICRYLPTNQASPCIGWSEWTEPMLAEGWIKRVLKGINPFEQRIKSYADTEVNTVVSMISQAGPRSVGNVPLNAAAANEFGLIEIYETVLQRGMGLSISGAPAVDYSPANDALLLVAGRLADLYMLLGNEAYADASDPTIAFGTDDGIYGSEASSIHCFMNQTSSLLDEELALLRGRDDSLLPSIQTYPIYNRLIWNFTGDINGGEVAYALNYNIRNENGDVDGVIDEADAKELYPQGHGDAWGHYLIAIKNYYRLLRNTHFTWVPRIEAVLVGGVPVSVDFLDERKFAQAAAAKARTGAEIVNLTYRQHYVEDPEGQYQGYLDDDSDRAWGLSEWASRAGQGTLIDWAVGNALLPEIDPTLVDNDPDNDHTGIQIIDRTTVTELRDIAARFQDIQGQVDMADAGLNPLGLAKNVIPFDIDPSGIVQNKTHFEQIYDRAVLALNNAISVFNHANNSTQLLRRQADSQADFERSTAEREADFKNRLIEVFGTPYEDDIGPTGTYESGYDGPDEDHYAMIDPVELVGITPLDVEELTLDIVDVSVGANGELMQSTHPTVFYLSEQFGHVKPSHWTGKRRATGEVQLARSDLLQTRLRFERALADYDNLLNEIESQAALLAAQHDLNATEIEILNTSSETQSRLSSEIHDLRTEQFYLRSAAGAAVVIANALSVAPPAVIGLANDGTSLARSAIRVAGALAAEVNNGYANIKELVVLNRQNSKESNQRFANIRVTALRQEREVLQKLAQLENLVRQEVSSRLELYTLQETLHQAEQRYQASIQRGLRLLEDRLRFRQQTAAMVQEYRYKDMAFRIFRNDALQKYRAQFDLAARYVYLAAKAYDYETNLLEGDPRGPGQDFMTEIIRSRSLGLVQNGVPQTGAGAGDAGLSDPMARMSSNWSLVLKGQLGFNNPQAETGRFSLRSELFRVQPGFNGDEAWREILRQHVVANLLNLEDFQRYCRIFQPHEPVEPGIVIPFSTTVNFGFNYFGWPLGGGDSSYDSTHFATKVRSVGVWFSNYNNLGGGIANTPRVYLVPVGMDIMRSPSSETGETREWRIVDQVLPVPFPLSAANLNDPTWIPQNDSVLGGFADIRRFSSFRAFHDSGNFNPAEVINDSRLIGRSVWNTQWLLIIPAGTLHSDRQEALDRFIDGRLLPNDQRDGNGVSDIKIFFQTYAYSGN